MSRLVGTRDEPRICEEIWRALRGDAGNEALRLAVAGTISAAPEREQLARIFRDTEVGVTPGVMIGKNEKSVLLRLLVWPFLLSLAADTAVNEAKRVAPALDISDARQDLLRQMLLEWPVWEGWCTGPDVDGISPQCRESRCQKCFHLIRRHFKRGLGGWGWDRVLLAKIARDLMKQI